MMAVKCGKSSSRQVVSRDVGRGSNSQVFMAHLEIISLTVSSDTA